MHGLPSHLSSFQPFLPVACERLAFAARPPDPSPLFPRLPALLSALPTFRAVPSPTAHWSQSTAAAQKMDVNVTVVTVLIAPKFWFSEIRRDSLALTVRTAVSLRSALEAQGPA